MGEAKRKAAKGEMPAETFKAGVLSINGQRFQLDRDGKVFGVQMVRGARVHDGALIGLVHEAARQIEAQRIAELKAAGQRPARKPRAARKTRPA
jgi:hypothetical protein